MIHFLIVKFFNWYFRNNKQDIIIKFNDEPIGLEVAEKIIKETDEEEKRDKYSNQYW
jgi:hypothetical protein